MATTDEVFEREPASATPPHGFDLLTRLYRDDQIEHVFSETRTIEAWLQVEAALAAAQAEAGVLTSAEAEAIAEAAVVANVDVDRLWRESTTVGYPILSIVRMIDAAVPADLRGRVHFGATTQDIMDSGLAMQLQEALARLDSLLEGLGDAIAAHVSAHRETVMAARTHAQQAVPTTFGAKLAVYLTELDRHRSRLAELRRRLCVVSLHGAGGTSAALGPQADVVRRNLARRLGLADAPVPWHVSRDAVAEFGMVCGLLGGTCARLGREVIDLSRTEICEVRETGGHHRGASSTMPQKANAISSEALVGIGTTLAGLAPTFVRVMEAGHERAAGEWQAEWYAVPTAARLTAAALKEGASLMEGLRVIPENMRANMQADYGLIMAEAYMIELARTIGREQAHDLVYAAATLSRAEQMDLETALREVLPVDVLGRLDGAFPIAPERYLGRAPEVCDAALTVWQNGKAVTLSAVAASGR